MSKSTDVEVPEFPGIEGQKRSFYLHLWNDGWGISLGLDGIDLLILSWLKYWTTMGMLQSRLETGEDGVTRKYYWISYTYVSDVFRIFGLGTNTAVYYRMLKLAGICREGGALVERDNIKDYPLIVSQQPSGGGKAYYALRAEAVHKLIAPANVFDIAARPPIEEPEDEIVLGSAFMEFMRKLNERSDAFKKHKLDKPTHLLQKAEKYYDAIMDGTFLTAYGSGLPRQQQNMSLTGLTDDKIIECITAMETSYKGGIDSYFLNYKKNYSMFLTFLQNRMKDAPVPAVALSEYKAPASLPKNIGAFLERRQPSLLTQKGITRHKEFYKFMERLGGDIAEMKSDGDWHITVGSMAQPTNVMTAWLDGFIEQYKHDINEWLVKVQPWQSDNYQWLVWARWVYSQYGVSLNKGRGAIRVTDDSVPWYVVDFKKYQSDDA